MCLSDKGKGGHTGPPVRVGCCTDRLTCLSDLGNGEHAGPAEQMHVGINMVNSLELPRRRSPRLHGYDYTLAGAYYVTISTLEHQHLFGQIVGNEMCLNDAGRMLEHWWDELLQAFPRVELDTVVVMPNHLHGIIIIYNEPADPGSTVPHENNASLPDIIQWYKTMTTNEYIRCVKTAGWPPFAGKVWHRSYYDRIIRDEDDLLRIRTYITNNPAQWMLDTENR